MLRLLLPFILLFNSVIVLAQEPADILKNHFKGYGQQLWNEVPDVTIDGRQVNAHYQSFSVKLTWSPPDKLRVEGKSIGVKAYDGAMAWAQTGAGEVRRLNATEELILRNSFFPGSPMHPVREHLVFQGLAAMEGVLYYSFLLDESVYRKTFYVGQDDHRLYYIKVETKMEPQPVEIRIVYEKYKNYNGLLVPTAVRFEGEGVDEELVYDQFYMGLGAKESIFSMPERH